jgi:hypothetical protein|tara:strand:- start:44 stop:256 length:213 start_codon:yes stop_codon:yes gene_type:complete
VLKTLLIIVIILILVSLASSLIFLFIDKGNPNKKRILYGLGFRVSLGVILVLLIAYGLYTGELGNSAPWG